MSSAMLKYDGSPYDAMYQAKPFTYTMRPSRQAGVCATNSLFSTSQDGSRVILTFSENVQVEPNQRTLSAFAGIDVVVYLRALIDVFVDGHRAHTHGAAISGDELTLTMDTTIRLGQAGEVAYDDVFARDVPGVIVDCQ